MENAEEVMQVLEEFSKIKPKEIPRELEDYLGYVAKTGDPVYQWSLVKNLFREKLVNVITDFYESTLTVDLPPCPNVDPFNYERMKTSLLERFDTFSSAPFTVQRICELLTNPRKEYNRADKYMRAIEKNILVVSTREPGSGKRPLESDSPSETILNGIPDVKLSESDASLIHVPTDLPYLGAPPASNDVTVETTEPNSAMSDRLTIDIEGEGKTFKPDGDKSWSSKQSVLTQESNEDSIKPETLITDVSLKTEVKIDEERDCDTNEKLTNVDNIDPNVSVIADNCKSETSSDMFAQSSETALPDCVDSSDLVAKECPVLPVLQSPKVETETSHNATDENEVSSTPADEIDLPLIEEVEEPTDSEAEATDTSVILDAESDINALCLPDSNINSTDVPVVDEHEIKSVTSCEVTPTKSDSIELECSEITRTVDSPIPPGNDSSLQVDDIADRNIELDVLEEKDQPIPHPDSSNDVCSGTKKKSAECVELQTPESCTEADSMSETSSNLQELHTKIDFIQSTPDQTDAKILSEDIPVTKVSSPVVSKSIGLDEVSESLEDQLISSNTHSTVSEAPEQSSNLLMEGTTQLKEVQSTSEVSEVMCDQERREGSVIQSIPNIISDNQQQITVEEISVDPSCEAEEEAMDIDDSSNQMMISEGENEGEPMEQCDQLQS